MIRVFVWTVQHQEHETVTVEAETRLNAIVTAARLWGVYWTDVGRECTAVIKGEIKKKMPKKQGKKEQKGEHCGD